MNLYKLHTHPEELAKYMEPTKEITDDGSIITRINGLNHSIDGNPATSWTNGTKKWFSHGRLHRVDGPAVIWDDGSEVWMIQGKRHRKDGPAVIDADGDGEWFLNGRNYENAEWEQKIK